MKIAGLIWTENPLPTRRDNRPTEDFVPCIAVTPYAEGLSWATSMDTISKITGAIPSAHARGMHPLPMWRDYRDLHRKR